MIKLLSVLALAASAATPKASLFLGHYGYTVSYPSGTEVTPKFGVNKNGAVTEVVRFAPPVCKDPTKRRECAEAGMVALYVQPKASVFKDMGVKDLAGQVAVMTDLAEKHGQKPGKPALGRVGKLTSMTYVNGNPGKELFDATTVIEGEKCLYLFQYNAKGKGVRALMNGLVEVAPTDVPPDLKGASSR